MAVLDRSELEASPLADLHAIADQIGLEGFRRLRKADLIDAILGSPRDPGEAGEEEQADERAGAREDDGEEAPARARRPRRRRLRRGSAGEADVDDGADESPGEPDPPSAVEREDETEPERGPRRSRRSRAGGRTRAAEEEEEQQPAREREDRVASGVVEVLGNGSAFLRVKPPEPSDEDVYISAAQVRRCELVSGDEVAGPVRTPRRSERYPSLVRIDTINGQAADAVSDGSRYEDLPVGWPEQRLSLGDEDRTLEAIEWLVPFGLGSRVSITGPRMAGKTRTLRRLLAALHGREGLELSLVLAGARPEDVADWAQGPVEAAVAVGLGTSAEAQAQAVERALDAAKRVAARGGDAVVLIDSLDGLTDHQARKALAAARNLRDGGSLTVIATAAEAIGGETTVIALDANLTTTGREPILDLIGSGTLRPELLVGEEGAQAIARARASALEV